MCLIKSYSQIAKQNAFLYLFFQADHLFFWIFFLDYIILSSCSPCFQCSIDLICVCPCFFLYLHPAWRSFVSCQGREEVYYHLPQKYKKCDKLRVFDSHLRNYFCSVQDTIEDIDSSNISEKVLLSNLKTELKIVLYWNMRPNLFLIFLSYGNMNMGRIWVFFKSMTLCTHLSWYKNFVQV